MQTTIRKFGNSKGAILPAQLLKELGLDVSDKVEVSIENDRIMIEPIRTPEYSLAELLAQTPKEAVVLDAETNDWLNGTQGKEANL